MQSSETLVAAHIKVLNARLVQFFGAPEKGGAGETAPANPLLTTT
jgi:hypothetical protein